MLLIVEGGDFYICHVNITPSLYPCVVYQEMSLKEEMLGKMEESLETFRRKFAMTRHQQGLLYKEYLDMKKVTND